MTPSDRLREAALYGDWFEVDELLYELVPEYCAFAELHDYAFRIARTFLLLVAEAME